MEQSVDKRDLIAQLAKTAHRELSLYVPVAARAVKEYPDFYAHLVAWNHVHGEVRDTQVALPVIALTDRTDEELVENALAHIADLRPYEFMRAMKFSRQLRTRAVLPNMPIQPTEMFDRSRLMRRLVERYLRDLEASFRDWESTALRHRETLRSLYAKYHIKPGTPALDAALMKGAAVQGKFAIVRQFAVMSPADVGAAITKNRLPFLVARGAVGARASETDIAMALINAMTDTEFVMHARAIKKWGLDTNPVLRAAFEKRLERAGTKKARKGKATLKTTRAAEVLQASGTDEKIVTKLRALQERQLDNLGGVEGNWLVLGDKSGSMSAAIALSRQVSAILARMAKGKVHLVFFDSMPTYMDATGKTYEEITSITARINAGGNTSIGCGLQYAVDKEFDIDGIVVVSDGGHNATPHFSVAYKAYEKKFGKSPTVYFYVTPGGDSDRLTGECAAVGIDVQVFDLRSGGTHGKVDFYSLPNLVQTMRVSRYSLLSEIMDTPLRRLDEVLDRTIGTSVLSKRSLVNA